jgi:hypothetical protein
LPEEIFWWGWGFGFCGGDESIAIQTAWSMSGDLQGLKAARFSRALGPAEAVPLLQSIL